MPPSRRSRLLVLTITCLLGTATCLAVNPAMAASATFHRACVPSHGRIATCFATYRAVRHGPRSRSEPPSGPELTPADIASAYRLPASAKTTTVAIIDAQDDPRAERDLATYRARFGLPVCSTANGCFRKVNQRGAKSPTPDPDPDWAVEISLDLDAVSAGCPSCHILLVEGDLPSFDALGIAVNTAVRLGAAVVSNSYGVEEFNGIESLGKKYYTHPGVAIVASSGDEGFGIPEFPAVLRTTIAVGGTSLTKAHSTTAHSMTRGWTEHAWDGASSGCSGYISKPKWQSDNHCPTRTVADVSAVADPDSGFLVYDSFGLGPDNGYLQVGGTSLSAPLIAGMIGRAGNAALFSDAHPIYAHPASIFDVKGGGSNGYCGGDYLCTALNGYDAPTGTGTPNGLGAL